MENMSSSHHLYSFGFTPFCLAVSRCRGIRQIDIQTAFLEEEVYMTQPPGYEHPHQFLLRLEMGNHPPQERQPPLLHLLPPPPPSSSYVSTKPAFFVAILQQKQTIFNPNPNVLTRLVIHDYRAFEGTANPTPPATPENKDDRPKAKQTEKK